MKDDFRVCEIYMSNESVFKEKTQFEVVKISC